MRLPDESLTRRVFLARSARWGAAAALGGGGALEGALHGARRGGRRDEPRPPLTVPTVRHAASGIALVAGQGAGGGWHGWGYDGAIPGPTLELRRGESLDVTLCNALPEPTSVHWHGLHAPPGMDGQPMQQVAPGGAFRYLFPVAQRAGTHWYHPHPHGRTAGQVARGLAGLLLVRDDEEDALALPRGARELPLVLRDARDRGDGRLGHRRWWLLGYRGDLPMANGAVRPVARVPAAAHRLRVVNAATARVFRLYPGERFPAWILGNDGGLLPEAVRAGEVALSPGERLDLLVDLAGARAGERLTIACRASGWTLATLEVTGEPVPDAWARPWVPPAALSHVEPLVAEPGVVHREFHFFGHWINGRGFDMHHPAFTVRRGVVERWRFRSGLGSPHPVHVHGAHFQVEARRGGRGRVMPWERGWKDTVLLEGGERVDVLVRFDAHAGPYLLHCHRLEHEDAGMMLGFVVA